MRYNIVKNASSILESNSYLVKNPFAYKGKWSSVFKNNNPICLELGMGRGTFIIEMAKTHPNINYIGLELDKNQTATALKNIKPIDFTPYEKEEEEKAIISYDELLSNTGQYELNYLNEEKNGDVLVKTVDLNNLINVKKSEPIKMEVHLMSLRKEEEFLKTLKELSKSLN